MPMLISPEPYKKEAIYLAVLSILRRTPPAIL